MEVLLHTAFVRPGNLVSIATHYILDGPGLNPSGVAIFSTPVQTSPVVRLASCTVGTGILPGVKQLELDINHPPHLALRLKKK